MHHHVIVELDHDKVLQLGEVLGEGGIKAVPVLVVDGGDELGLVHVEVVVEGVVPVLNDLTVVWQLSTFDGTTLLLYVKPGPG